MLFFCFALFAFSAPAFAAITANAPSTLTLQDLDQFRSAGIPEDKWPMLLDTLASPEESAAVRSLIRELKPFPSARLVGLLTHARLSVRSAALDLLEDAANDTFGFDVWQENPTGGANTEPLEKWKTWAEKGTVATTATVGGKLTDETFRVIATEITSGSRDRAERAMTRLDAFGLPAISHLEAFMASQPNLAPAPRAALKAAEYRLALRTCMPRQAAALARDLALGTPEIQSTSLAALNKAGPGALPVIADFLDSPDPLVRETAVDAAFSAGEKHAVSLVMPRIAKEKVESVLHAMIRGLGDHGSTAEHGKAIAGFLQHPSENVIITALEALGTTNAGVFADDLASKLTDPRWRVRAAALESIGKRNFGQLKEKVIEALKDADLFVRVTAASTILHVASSEGQKILVEQFEKSHELKAPILRLLLSGRQAPPAKVWDLLAKAPPDIILQCLDTFESRDDHEGKNIPYAAPFAKHPNPDVSAAALRLLASRGLHTALLLEALQSSDTVKQDAVLDQLHLRRGTLAGTSGAAAVAPTEPSGNPKLDRLYESFRAAAPKPDANAGAAPMNDSSAPPAQLRAVLTKFLRQGSPHQKLRAAIVLAGEGDLEATKHVLSVYDTLSGLDRRHVTGVLANLGTWPGGPARELAQRLIRDTTDDVRETAIHSWIEDAPPERLPELLAELSRAGSLLKPDDIYDYYFDQMLKQPSARAQVAAWAGKVLGEAASPDPHKVFAVVLLSRTGQASGNAQVTALLESKNPWLRRAAYRALGLAHAQAHLDALLRDDSAHVRAVLPFLVSPDNYGWQHWFDDAHSATDYDDYNRNFSSTPAFGSWAQKGQPAKPTQPTTTTKADPADTQAALEKLTRDPSDLVRFEAQFALLRMGRSIDPTTFAGLLASQTEESNARTRVGNFLERNFTRLGKSYGILVPLVASMSDSDTERMLQHFGLNDEKAFTSFAAIAQLAPAAPTKADLEIAPPVPPPTTAAAPTDFTVLFYKKVGCQECKRAADMLAEVAHDFPRMVLKERDIEDREAQMEAAILGARYGIPINLRQTAPVIFTQESYLLKTGITIPALGDLLRRTAAAAPKPGWDKFERAEIAAAQQAAVQSFDSFTMAAILGAALLDGINPCAFATIIFLLSYLHVARRTPREILAVGIAFILAVFGTYFLVGLGIGELLKQIAGLDWARTALNYTLAGFALIVAVLSFRDAQLASRGQMAEMTLQLPGLLKDRIRYTIRTSSRSSRYVFAAFGAGIFISLLELACTGQVYLPTIQLMYQQGRTSAIGYLALYNLVFVIPLIVVFIAAWFGLKSDALIRFQKNHTALVKTLTGILFLLLTAFLLFGHDLLARAPIGG